MCVLECRNLCQVHERQGSAQLATGRHFGMLWIRNLYFSFAVMYLGGRITTVSCRRRTLASSGSTPVMQRCQTKQDFASLCLGQLSTRVHRTRFDFTDRIISMGFPSEGVEANYRNPLPEVQRFFREKHPDGKVRIYNLCSEREYPPSKFEGIGTCTWYPFDDHNPVRISCNSIYLQLRGHASFCTGPSCCHSCLRRRHARFLVQGP